MTENKAQSATGKSSSSARLLLVDDEPHVLETLRRWLSAEGYDCETAATAEEAWELIQHADFSLLVTDIRLPGKSGIELLTMTAERFPAMAVIVITAVDDRETAIRALQLGAYGYVIKPFDANEVLINVVNALERRRLVLASQAYEHRLEAQVREQTDDIRMSREEIVLRLITAQEFRHDETGAHIRRLGMYAEAIGNRMGHSREHTDTLRLAAAMHDVGKIGIPDAILLKPGKLTSRETAIMQTHTTIGARILGGTRIGLLNVARDVALCHHEKCDGSGYPHRLAGDAIPESARIAAVVDVYDALVHDRVYRAAMAEEKALVVIAEGRGKHFDPTVLDVFMELLPEMRSIRERVEDEAGR